MNIPTIEEIITQDRETLRACPHKLDCASCDEDICVMIASVADFPTEYGRFRIVAFVNNKDEKDHIVILKGEIGDGEGILTRVHSACLTGDALGSLRCDCGPQLHHALQLIEAEGLGIVLYHQAEGRGIGLVNKLRAYALQDGGYDTMDANLALGFGADEREYRIPAEMLKKLGVRSIRLMTNNPEKVAAMETEGVRVLERVQHELPSHDHDRNYMSTKKERFGHLLTLDHDSRR
ncbi:MAG: GTP cyclohydrolase II [Spirochaetes bacterium RIFOXYC1_FULL_54_7]|nr:MAG: GTP cyclohydrolase II [Spirochaetes bacterium RIFOXYC1_FULL_54_7]